MIEIVQPLFNREKELLDLVFNSIGAITGIIVGMGFLMIIQRSGDGKRDI
jgi:VanZ family protein